MLRTYLNKNAVACAVFQRAMLARFFWGGDDYANRMRSSDRRHGGGRRL
jgi:hypothetical protein